MVARRSIGTRNLSEKVTEITRDITSKPRFTLIVVIIFPSVLMISYTPFDFVLEDWRLHDDNGENMVESAFLGNMECLCLCASMKVINMR